mmetsp:Transcript_13016/g.41107  ORF Transcript_13016/g.41107 Transcript_13016/m.41107 type:complete len:202 (+) Transcript_13016:19-624(+)
MKVTSISIFRHNGAGTDPTCLGAVSDLQNFGFFQRPAVREMLTFVSRTIVTRTEPGQRQSVEHEEFVGHVCCNRESLAAIVFVDKEYPARSAFCVVNKVLDDFVEKHGASWKTITADCEMGNELLEPALVKYQVRGGPIAHLPAAPASAGRLPSPPRRVGRGNAGANPPLHLPYHRTPPRRTSWPRSRRSWMRPRSSYTRQ